MHQFKLPSVNGVNEESAASIGSVQVIGVDGNVKGHRSCAKARW